MRGCRRPLIFCPTVCYEARIWSRRMAYLDKQKEPSLLFCVPSHPLHLFQRSLLSFFFFPPLRPALQLPLLPSVSPLGFISFSFLGGAESASLPSHVIFMEDNPKHVNSNQAHLSLMREVGQKAAGPEVCFRSPQCVFSWARWQDMQNISKSYFSRV